MTCSLVMGCLLLFCSLRLIDGDADTALPPVIDKPPTDTVTHPSCPVNDAVCERDWIGFEAICQLHAQIDDDHNGSLDRFESDEFIREDLEHSGAAGYSFHGTDDLISVHELWQIWINSSVYNWTVDEVVSWLVSEVELPQYADTFRVNAIDGRVLPRLALSSHAFATVLGIKNAVHRRKLSVKASDLVLFGPPKWSHRYYVDAVVVVSLLVTVVCCWLSYHSRHSTRSQTERLMKDLAALQSAEDSLKTLQKQLETARLEEQKTVDDRHLLELQLEIEVSKMKGEKERIRNLGSPEKKSELRMVEEELMRLRTMLSGMEYRLRAICSPPAELQQWLQLTYEIETRYFDRKRLAADTQLKAAKDMCEKLHCQKGRFLSAMRMAHTTSLDDTDQTISSVRCSVEEVRKALQERVQRWQLIEHICSFDVVSNPGLSALESLLGPALKKAPKVSPVSNYGRPTDLDLTDEEMPSLAVLSQVTARRSSVTRRSFPRIQSVPALAASLPRNGLGSLGSSRQLTTQYYNNNDDTVTVHEELGEDMSDKSRVSFDVGDDLSLTPLSSVTDNVESHHPEPQQRSLCLCRRNSVTVPSSLADSAISLSATESSVTLGSGGKDRSSDVTTESRQVCRDSSSRAEDSPTGSAGKKKKMGLSRLLRGKTKEL